MLKIYENNDDTREPTKPTTKPSPHSPIIIRGSYFEDEDEPIIRVTSQEEENDYSSVDELDLDFDLDLDHDSNRADIKEDGNLGVFLYQAILSTIIAIVYTVISMATAPISENFLLTIKTISTNDFSFSDTIYNSVTTFFTYMNEQRPLELNAQLLGEVVEVEEIIDPTPVEVELDEVITPTDDIIEDILVDITTDTTVEESILLEESDSFEEESPIHEVESIPTTATVQDGVELVVPANATLTPIIFAGDITFPIDEYYRVSSGYGFRTNPITKEDEFHTAYDLAANEGTNILAVLDGVVVNSRTNEDLGNYITLDHGSGLTTLYGHCYDLLVESGDTVKQGDIIATVGSTGTSTGNHLHFGMKMDGIYFDPAYVFTGLQPLEGE